MSEINIMDLDIDNLSEKQYDYLKNHTISILKDIQNDLENDRLGNIVSKLSLSPAGDCVGQNNYYINFAYKDGEQLDLSDILDKMAKLSNYDLEWGDY